MRFVWVFLECRAISLRSIRTAFGAISLSLNTHGLRRYFALAQYARPSALFRSRSIRASILLCRRNDVDSRKQGRDEGNVLCTRPTATTLLTTKMRIPASTKYVPLRPAIRSTVTQTYTFKCGYIGLDAHNSFRQLEIWVRRRFLPTLVSGTE